MRFASKQDEKLWRFVTRFDRFASERQDKDLRSILRTASSPVVYKFIGSYSLDGWLASFRRELTTSTRNLDGFLRRREEFGNIVFAFIRYFVQELQQELLKQPPLSEDVINHLEEFRAEFAAFLRDVEEWGELVNETTPRGKTTRGVYSFPTQFFRVPTFSRAAVIAVNRQ